MQNLLYTKMIEQILNEIKTRNLRAFSILNDESYYINLKQKAQTFKKYKKIYVVGLGGSFLAAKALMEALYFKSQFIEFIYYIEEDILNQTLSQITTKDLIICISKSGKTKETIFIINKIIENGVCKNVVCITGDKESDLYKIAIKNNFEVLEHEDVSGRFSFLTNVALLPLLIAGFNLEEFLQGAKLAIKQISSGESQDFISSIKQQLYNKNINLNILMPYSIKLEWFTKWFCQLYAESLNRKEFKIMPYPSIGTVDQHSVLEGYLQNPQDKMINFIVKKENSLLYEEYKITKYMCNKMNIHTRTFEFEEIKERELGFLMCYFGIEVLYIAKVLGIDPFNQEMVEKRKSFQNYEVL